MKCFFEYETRWEDKHVKNKVKIWKLTSSLRFKYKNGDENEKYEKRKKDGFDEKKCGNFLNFHSEWTMRWGVKK